MDLCLHQGTVFARGSGFRSFVKSTSWEPITIPTEEPVEFYSLTAEKGFETTTIVVVCKKSAYLLKRGSPTALLASLLQVGDEFVSYCPKESSSSVAGCLVTSHGIPYSFGSHKDSGLLVQDCQDWPVSARPGPHAHGYNKFGSSLNAAVPIDGVLRVVPEGDQVVSVEALPRSFSSPLPSCYYEFPFCFATRNGGKIRISEEKVSGNHTRYDYVHIASSERRATFRLKELVFETSA
jgi:hypothetical protein